MISLKNIKFAPQRSFDNGLVYNYLKESKNGAFFS